MIFGEQKYGKQRCFLGVSLYFLTRFVLPEIPGTVQQDSFSNENLEAAKVKETGIYNIVCHSLINLSYVKTRFVNVNPASANCAKPTTSGRFYTFVHDSK